MEEVRSYWQVTSIHHFCNTFGKQFKLPSCEPEELEQAFILDIPVPQKPATSLSSSSSLSASSLSVTSNRNNNNNYNNNTDINISSNSNSNNGHHQNSGGDIIPNETSEHIVNGEQQNNNDHEPGTTTPTGDHHQLMSNGKQQRHESPDLDEVETGDQEDKKKNDKRKHDDDDDEDYKPPIHLINTQQQQFLEPQPPQQQNNDEQENLHLLVKLAIALMKPHFNCKLTQANWENYLKRLVDKYWVDLEHCPSPFVVPLISQDGVELTKNLTFNELPLSDKIDLFYALCDYRLWCEDAAEALKDYSLEELRLESIGKDSQGYEYWYFSGARLYRENKELSQDIIMRKKRIKELEYKLIDLEKTRIFRDQEEKRKAELEKAKQQAAEAREARLAAKRQQEQEAKEAKEHKAKELRRKKQSTPVLPPRTGLRERRSSATSNNNDKSQSQTQTPMRTTRSRLSQQQQQPQLQPEHQPEQQGDQTPQQSAQKSSRTKSTRQCNQRDDKTSTPDLPKKPPEEECREELEKLHITKEDRAEAWSLQCESLESWESFAAKFEKTKSINEKYLVAHINEYILPYIRSIYAKKAAEARRKEKELLLSLTSRRVSTRIISKKAQEEEEERQAQIREAEMHRKKIEAETRLRAELEREMRAKKNRLLLNGGTSSTCSEDGEPIDGSGVRYNLRQQQVAQEQVDSVEAGEFDGVIHPDKLSDFYEAVELVVDTVRTSKHAWPFADPVPETVPGYYDLIKEPMDLRKLRTKVEFREYKSLIELEKDFQLLVNNCEKFNGPKNIYTKMVYKLWKSFRKNVRLYLQRDLFMDENETFIYPPIMAPPPPPPPPPPVPPQTLKEEQSQNHQEYSQLPNNHDNEICEKKVATPQNNHISQEILEPSTNEPVLPYPEQIISTNSPQMTNEVSPIHETKATSPPPAKLPRLEPTGSDLLPKNQETPASAPLLTCNQIKEEEPQLTTISEEIIIDSYDVDCPDDNFFIWSQDMKSDEKIDN